MSPKSAATAHRNCTVALRAQCVCRRCSRAQCEEHSCALSCQEHQAQRHVLVHNLDWAHVLLSNVWLKVIEGELRLIRGEGQGAGGHPWRHPAAHQPISPPLTFSPAHSHSQPCCKHLQRLSERETLLRRRFARRSAVT